MSQDWYSDGYNQGRGHGWLNEGHDSPQSDSDHYSYERGYKEGERRKEISKEIDDEWY